MKKELVTETKEYFYFTRKQTEFVFELFLKLGMWKILEILGLSRQSEDEEFLEDFWHELDEALNND